MGRPVLFHAKCDGAILAACVGAAAATVSSCRPSQSQAESKRTDGGRQYLETYLMDRIAKKPYLNYHSTPSSVHQRQTTMRHRGGQSEEHPTDVDGVPVATSSRPRGVPSRLRLLAIDVPQFKEEAFENGICKLPSEVFDADKPSPSFVDGVAPPKPINDSFGNNQRTRMRSSRKPIVQKSLAKQLYYCYDPPRKNTETDNDNGGTTSNSSGKSNEKSPLSDEKHPQPQIGVEILEASIMNMNPNNIRRTYTSAVNWRKKIYKYDPGKYTEGNAGVDADSDGDSVADVDDVDVDDEEEALEQKDSIPLVPGFGGDSEEIERTSPWNQYAWLEEIQLRMNGVVPFGAPMQRAHIISQWIYGRIYRQSIPASSSRGGWVGWLWWPVLWSGSHAIGSERYRSSWDGVDGDGENILYGSDAGKTSRFLPWLSPSKKALNRASNKPHAVICDGAAMQRVPGSLRYLTKICRDAQVPLYILNDTRSWGSQTHSTLSDALVDLRKTVSDNVVKEALALREGSAFERGRFVGQLEKEIAWQAYDSARKTREALMDARRRLRMEKVEDWSGLTEDELLKKLIERQVIVVQGDDDEGLGDAIVSDKLNSMKVSKGFDGICRRCLEAQSENRQTTD